MAWKPLNSLLLVRAVLRLVRDPRRLDEVFRDLTMREAA